MSKGPQSFQFKWENAIRATNHQGPKLSLGERSLAMTYFGYGRADGSSIRPTLDRLSADLTMGKTTIRKHRKRLEALGFLELVSQSNGPGSANVYRLSLPADWTPCSCPLCPARGAPAVTMATTTTAPATTTTVIATDESERGPRQGEPLPTAKGLTSEEKGLTSGEKGSAPGRALSTHYINSTTSTQRTINSKKRTAEVPTGVILNLIDAAPNLRALERVFEEYSDLTDEWAKSWVKQAWDERVRSLT